MYKRVLICANPDLNYIDGSSIWLQTIALASAAAGAAEVEFLAKSTPQRDELFGPLRFVENITILDGSNPGQQIAPRPGRLTLSMMAKEAIRLDQIKNYDVIIVRGLEIVSQLLQTPAVLAKCWVYLTDIPQTLEDYQPDLRIKMQRIANGCQLLLCQTQGFQSLWQALVPDLDPEKIKLYTPVIPDLPRAVLPISARPRCAVYAGKFKGDWMTLEMAKVWPAVHRQLPASEMLMIGDKIHDEPERPKYKQMMSEVLKSTLGLRWLGALPREQVQKQMQQARVGLSWRHESMNDTVEYSTKILEYGGAGCAAILNRNPLHEELLGKHYPLFANIRGVRCSNFLDQGQSDTQHARNHEQESLSTLHPGVQRQGSRHAQPW